MERVPMQPGTENDFLREPRRLARKIRKNRLGNVLREMRVPRDNPASCRIHQINVRPDEIRERGLGAVLHEFSQQCLLIGMHVCQ